MSRDIAPYVSAVSAMLAAYGFFFNAFKDRMDKADAVGVRESAANLRKKQIDTVRKGRTMARRLALVPLLIWLLFLDKIEDGLVHSTWDPGRYETLDVLFFVLANGWLLIATAVAVRYRALTKKLAALQQPEQPKRDAAGAPAAAGQETAG